MFVLAAENTQVCRVTRVKHPEHKWNHDARRVSGLFGRIVMIHEALSVLNIILF